ncbi:MAG: S1 RNA-binding domain-containing protein [Anaerolineae bacterium]|nr:S1 RNA-binding domain-containing protein [Anaerolineae bacterium]
MRKMLEDYLSCRQLKPGTIVTGIVVRVAHNNVIVDVGAKCDGVVPEQDLARLTPEERAAIREGEEVFVYITHLGDEFDNIMLSLSRARMARDWFEAQRLLESGEVLESQVVGCNKGGVIVQVGQLRGFVPSSQLDVSRLTSSSPKLDGDLRWKGLLGTTLKLKVIEVDQSRNRLILSERMTSRERSEERRQSLLDRLTEGDVVAGKVTNITDFGAFVDIGGVDGLVHLSELSWKRVAHPREVVRVGEEVQVYVLGVDRERQRVSLSIKRLHPDPWIAIEERYHQGQLLEGVITRLTKWGAFASIVGDEAIEGLIHVSELDESSVTHPEEILRPGQVVTLRVIEVDGSRRRLALSLKRVAQEKAGEESWRAAPLEVAQDKLESDELWTT